MSTDFGQYNSYGDVSSSIRGKFVKEIECEVWAVGGFLVIFSTYAFCCVFIVIHKVISHIQLLDTIFNLEI